MSRQQSRVVPGQQRSGTGLRRDQHIDEIAVERACNGDPVRLTVHERARVVGILTARGLSANAIAERLRLARRSVQRYRAGEIKAVREAAA